MNRDYSTGRKKMISFFVGNEIELTPAYNKKTLFVVGIQSKTEIIRNCKKYGIEHVYLGANQSFKRAISKNKVTIGDQILTLLKLGYWVTVDIVPNMLRLFDEYLTHEKFIVNISCPIPNIAKLNKKNIIIKIDDIGFNRTNSGVWCSDLNTICIEKKYTDFKQYKNDEVIK